MSKGIYMKFPAKDVTIDGDWAIVLIDNPDMFLKAVLQHMVTGEDVAMVRRAGR